jgi:hypothetical protein
MATTTIATSLELIKDTTLRMMVDEFFVTPDPATARIPMALAPPGFEWLQEYTTAHTAATAFAHWDTLTPFGFDIERYRAFLSGIAKQDQRNKAQSALGEGQQGRNDRLKKKQMIIKSMSELWREYVYTGEPVTVAVGGNLAAVIGANAVIELGPRCVRYQNVHQFAGATTTTEGLIQWNLAAQTLSYMSPNDTQYGPPVVITAANRHRVALWSGGGTAASKNEPEWIRVTIAAADLAALLASGNFVPTAGVAADVLTFTPTKQMTGLYRQISPMMQCYHDLSGTPPVSGISTAANGPAAGGSLNREALSWIKQRLLDASNNRPDMCAIFMSDNLLIRAEGLVPALGQGAPTTMFLGSEINALSYGGIPFIRNQWLPTNLDSLDGTRDDLTLMMGAVFGEENTHIKYQTLAGDPTNQIVADVTTGTVTAVGDGTPTGSPVPLTYWEDLYSPNQLVVNQQAHMMGEPVAQLQDLCAVTHLNNG